MFGSAPHSLLRSPILVQKSDSGVRIPGGTVSDLSDTSTPPESALYCRDFLSNELRIACFSVFRSRRENTDSGPSPLGPLRCLVCALVPRITKQSALTASSM